MLPVQVEYWKLEETKRHNAVVEQLDRANLDLRAYEAESGRMTSSANVSNAQANLANAETNRRNAATNERNAVVNERNAKSNEENVISNRINAEANTRNAESNATNAKANLQNAQTNVQNAKTNWENARSSRMQADAALEQADAATLKAETEAEYRQWEMYGPGYELRSKEVTNDFLKLGPQYQTADANTMRSQAAQREASVSEQKLPYEQKQIKSQTDLNKAKTVNTWVDSVQKGVNLATDLGEKAGRKIKEAMNSFVVWQYTK